MSTNLESTGNLSASDLPPEPAKKKRRWPGILFGSIVVLLVLLHFAVPPIATRIANDQLPKQLRTEASLGGISVNLASGNFGVRALTIQQPEGFDSDPLLQLGSVRLRAPVSKAVRQNPVQVRNLHLDGLNLNLIANEEGVLNITKIGPEPTEPEPEPDDEETAPPPPLWIEQILLENIEVAFSNLANEWSIELSDIRLEILNLQVEHDAGTGPAILEGQVGFTSEKANGMLRLHGKIGTIEPSKPEQAPVIQLAVGLIGFDLDLIRPYLVPSPSVAKTAFGGSGFDFTLFMSIFPGESPEEQEIAGAFRLETDGGQITSNIVDGTLASPNLSFMALFTNILGNQFGRVTRLGTNVARGGVEAGRAVAETGVTAVTGAGRAVGGLASGALRTARGVATLDREEVTGGLRDTTVGTVSDVASTVGDTAGAAARGVGQSVQVARGQDQIREWWENVDERVNAFDQAVAEWFEENPFPL